MGTRDQFALWIDRLSSSEDLLPEENPAHEPSSVPTPYPVVRDGGSPYLHMDFAAGDPKQQFENWWWNNPII